MPYFWFHAFRRDDPAAVLEVLRNGAFPPPPGGAAGATTRANEGDLGIAPGCVYAYLGQTLEEFGEYAVGLGEDALDGGGATISPFDTGGLVGHHSPVKDWEQDARRAYLGHFSWPAAELAQRLAEHPTGTPGLINAYLEGVRPGGAGPHEVFAGDQADPTRVATIWQDAKDMRAWLWEGRTAHLQVPAKLSHWSCAPVLFERIQKHCETIDSEPEASWVEQIMPLYVDGGVAFLVRKLLDRQRVAA